MMRKPFMVTLIGLAALKAHAEYEIRPGDTLSGLAKSDLGRAAVPALSKKKKLSEEWRLLPLQNWEKFVFKSDPAIDLDGFDRRSRVAKVIVDKTHASSMKLRLRKPVFEKAVACLRHVLCLVMRIFARRTCNSSKSLS